MTAIDYDAWAQKYDETRGVSASVLRPLLEALGPPDGRSLLDIGGGTGNYSLALSEAGFRVTHCDPSPGMAEQAGAKLAYDSAAVVIGDGQALPFRDGTFDCAIAIKVWNHVSDRRLFASEARRVSRAGPLVLVHATQESIAGNWICHYVPSLASQERFQVEGETFDALRAAGYSRIEAGHIRYLDVLDGSAQALKRFPDTFLSDDRIMNTSLFSRLPDDERQDALAAIRRDYKSGRLGEVIAEYDEMSQAVGDGTMFVAVR